MTVRERDEAAAGTPVFEDPVAALRHELRNSLATIRNALFYVRRRVAGTDVYTDDARLRRFFEILDAEVESASELVERALGGPRGDESVSGVLPSAADADDALLGLVVARLLLVDDDASVRITLSALLEDEGFAVELAASAAEARAKLGAGTAFDLVVLDQHLGDGLGRDLVPLVRGALPGARVILLSGEEPEPGGPPIDARFAKGDAPEELFRALRRMLLG